MTGGGGGREETGPVAGEVAPPRGKKALQMVGVNRGIQGHQNSCYLDATLFSMFAFNRLVDGIWAVQLFA